MRVALPRFWFHLVKHFSFLLSTKLVCARGYHACPSFSLSIVIIIVVIIIIIIIIVYALCVCAVFLALHKTKKGVTHLTVFFLFMLFSVVIRLLTVCSTLCRT